MLKCTQKCILDGRYKKHVNVKTSDYKLISIYQLIIINISESASFLLVQLAEV